MPPPIIAAVDPRRADVAPAALAALLARALGAPLVLAAAYPVDLSIANLDPDHAGAPRREAERALARLAAQVAAPVTTAALEADASTARALHEFAEREQATALVIGSSARGPVGRVLPGAVTDRLLHGAPCPVAVAPVGTAVIDDPRLIGVGFTDTPDGHAALATARALAVRTGAKVRVLSVAEPLDPLIGGVLDGLALEYSRRARAEAAEQAVRRGIDAVPAAAAAGGEVLSGHAADALAAASCDLDLLVCGSRGHGPVRTLVLGGTSHALVRRAASPVLVVPEGHAVADPADDAFVARGLDVGSDRS